MMPVLIVIVCSFFLTILGIKLFRKMALNTFPSLVQKDDKGNAVINGAGGTCWDVAFLFSLYLYWYQGVSFSFLFVILLSSLLFALLGLFDDINELSPLGKLKGQIIVSIISLFAFFYFRDVPFSLGLGLVLLFALVWIVNMINFMDILDGLMGSLILLILIAFYFLFHKISYFPALYFILFWISVITAFLSQNLFHPKVYSGDSGAHLLGSLLFFLSIEFVLQAKCSSSALISLSALYSFLIFDFLFVCFIRFIKGKSFFLKSHDHFTFSLLLKTGSKRTTLLIMNFIQLIACIFAISLL